jgi:hypothetical protein
MSTPMGLLFAVLCVCGLLKTIDLADLWFNNEYLWHRICIPLLGITTFFSTILLFWIAIRLRNVFKAVRNIEKETQECVNNLQVAHETAVNTKHNPQIFRTTGDRWESSR